MNEYKIACNSDNRDTMSAFKDGDEIAIHGFHCDKMWLSVYTSPADARAFARGILALADEVDGGEAEPEPAKVGDQIRVLIDNAHGADVRAGDVFTLARVDYDGDFVVDRTDWHGRADVWFFRPEHVEKVIEPTQETSEPLAAWEYDLLEDKPANAPSRASLLAQARDLMDGSSTYSASDLTSLADYLAEEK